MMKRWVAMVEFAAETPADDLEADDMADRLSTDLGRAVEYLNGVATGSVSVRECSSVEEGFAVTLVWGRA